MQLMSVASRASDKLWGQVPQKFSCAFRARRCNQLESSLDVVIIDVCNGNTCVKRESKVRTESKPLFKS